MTCFQQSINYSKARISPISSHKKDAVPVEILVINQLNTIPSLKCF